MHNTYLRRVNLMWLWGLTWLLSACQSTHYLAPTPNVYQPPHPYPSKHLSRFLKTTTPEILFVTDRRDQPTKKKSINYVAKRSDSMTVGSITVDFGHHLSWAYLKSQSESKFRSSKIPLEITAIRKLITFPDTPRPFSAKNGVIIPDARIENIYKRKAGQFKTIINRYLNKAKTDEVTLFIHGYNDSFRDAALAFANVWHTTGRVGVPVLYSWPAGSGGLFGYFKDRESGDFTIYHLKETLRIIADDKHVKHINIIAHSRGSDIITTAFRELVIEAKAKKENLKKVMKVRSLTLAAPDLDFGVVSQRLIAEQFGPFIGQINVYINRGDSALSLSELIMSGNRFGKLTSDELTPNEKRIFSNIKSVYFIDVEDIHSFSGHDYYRRNPGVLSDLAMILEKDAIPGNKRRPLVKELFNFWCLPKGYPYQTDIRGCEHKKKR